MSSSSHAKKLNLEEVEKEAKKLRKKSEKESHAKIIGTSTLVFEYDIEELKTQEKKIDEFFELYKN